MTYEEFFNIRNQLSQYRERLDFKTRNTLASCMRHIEHCRIIPRYLGCRLKELAEKYIN